MRRSRQGQGAGELSRRALLRAGVAVACGELAAPMLGFGRCRLEASEPVEVSRRAADLVFGSLVIDMLSLLTLDWPRLSHWQEHPESFAENDFRALERAGIDIFHPAVETNAHDPHAGALRWATGWNRLLDSSPCFLARVASPAQLRQEREIGELGVVIGFQDADHFRTVADVEAFARLGQRVSQLTYNGTNRLGSGCYVGHDAGLSDFGSEIVQAMNRSGMAIDLSHCGERTTLDAIALSRSAALVTHANCAALVPGQPRCKPDAVIRALAAKGGVMGITVVRSFVGPGAPTLDDLLNHFEHVIRLVGVEHVGIGSDVDVTARESGSGRLRPFYAIRGLDPVARIFQIADGLLRRGYAERDVALVLGGNFERALASIWPADAGDGSPESNRRRDPFCPAPQRAAVGEPAT